MALIAFKANVRPSNEQKQDLLTLFEAIKGLGAQHMGIVFTFCDNDDMKKLVDKTKNPADGKVIKWKSWTE